MPDIGVSDDYAVLTAGGCRFYYGYEDVDQDNEEWMFTAQLPGIGGEAVTRQELLAANDQLAQGSRTEDFLLTGIGILIERGFLVPSVSADGGEEVVDIESRTIYHGARLVDEKW